MHIQQLKYDEAILELKTAANLAGQSTETLAALAVTYAAAGKRRSAQRLVDELEDLKGKRYVLPYNIAKIHASSGNKEKAFE